MELPHLKIGKIEVPVPIIQGGMAVRISLSALAAAVSNCGGIGVIGGSGIPPEEVGEEVRKAKELTDGPIGVNLMVATKQFMNSVCKSIQEKVDLLIVGAGFSRDVFRIALPEGVEVVPVVSSAKAASMSEHFGASAVVLEGGDAGGHLGTTKSVWELLPEVIKAVKIPVIAAGGIFYGSDIVKALKIGAAGVQMGTRLAASIESNAADSWKQMYIKAKDEDVVLICSPVGLPGRAMINPFVEKIKDSIDGAKVKCIQCLKHCQKNYCIFDVLVKAQQGDVDNGLIFCGSRVGEVKEILSVSEIFNNIIDEAKVAMSASRAGA